MDCELYLHKEVFQKTTQVNDSVHTQSPSTENKGGD